MQIDWLVVLGVYAAGVVVCSVVGGALWPAEKMSGDPTYLRMALYSRMDGARISVLMVTAMFWPITLPVFALVLAFERLIGLGGALRRAVKPDDRA